MRLGLLDERQLDELREAVFERLAVQGEFNWVEYSLGSARPRWMIAGRTAPEALFGFGQHRARRRRAGHGHSRRRRSRTSAVAAADIEAFCRVADALPQVAVVEPPCMPGDAAAARLAAVAHALSVSGKHVMAVCGSLPETSTVIEMAAVAAGGKEELRQRPLVTIALMPGVGGTAAAAAAAAGVPCLIAMDPSFLAADDGTIPWPHRLPRRSA